MTTTPASMPADTYGIETTVNGITIETVTLTETRQVEQVPDQKNAIADEIEYDKRIDLKLTYRGTKLTTTGGIVTYNNIKYAVDSHEEAGSYNGLKRYNLSAHRFNNYPKGA